VKPSPPLGPDQVNVNVYEDALNLGCKRDRRAAPHASAPPEDIGRR
jgi:hypothetical protein